MRKNKKKLSGIFFSTASIVVLVMILVFMLNSFISQWRHKEEINKEVETLLEKQKELRSANDQLEDNLKFLGTASYKSKIARSLNMKIEGEEVVIFPENSNVLKKNVPVESKYESESNPYKWWKYFFQRKQV